ncbi:hypothetical protein FNV43_RR05958 [Rhamnella rubrinervis]|uniref:Fe2OG dioxygenase domain-containing protein n=1 Tax=Rhamnella rubrinervis TaxID=2594499 RepID=A0A8K0HDK5_9ROSA|nr:hypothetical protein FNV43_RR05958 [Rhamnella rubrinervis]
MASKIASGFASSDQSQVSVQELAKEPLIAVPQGFVRVDDDHLRPPNDLFDETTNMPTIDMNKLVNTGEATDVDDELEKLHITCQEWGIFQLVNHGISSELLEKLKHEIEAWFNLPLEEKMKYKIRPGEIEGYGTIAKTHDQNLDWSDRFFMIINPILRRKPHLFPQLPPSLRATLQCYFLQLNKLAMALVGLLARALNIDVKEIKELVEDGMQSVRMTYYPPCPQPERVIGLSPHSDADVITILHQLNGVHGLQIKKDGVWIPVNLVQHAFVVNVGDILEIMSNGMYKSVVHRAMVNSDKERISLAMFFKLKCEAEVGPLASLINPQNPPLFKRIPMEKYVKDYISRRKFDGKTYLEQMRIKNGGTETAS